MKLIQFLPWKAKSDQIIIGALTSYFQGPGTRVKSGAIIDPGQVTQKEVN